MKTIELLRQIAGRIRPVSGADALFESKLMLASLLHTDLSSLNASNEAELDETVLEQLDDTVTKRQSGYPLQYLLGEWEFMGLPFFTDPCALIPRADTEILAELAVKTVRARHFHTVLDLCAGTGCIGISVAKMTGASVTLSDISADCCELIRVNAARNGVAVSVRTGDMFGAVTGERFDLIVSNPPYIPSDVIATLQTEVSYEPRLALDGGTDGLDFYRTIAADYKNYLAPGGMLMMEIGYDQGETVPALFDGGNVIKDYGGNARVTVIPGIDIYA